MRKLARDEQVARNIFLERSEAPAASTVEILHEALDSLPQGVVMFSADGRLLFSNQCYSEIYDLSAGEVKPGLSLEDLFILRGGAGSFGATERRYCDRLLETVAKGQIVSGYLNTRDGRTIHCINSPLPSGGWIVTHEDVTQQRQAEKLIVHMASHDPLTDLLNRTSFKSQLDEVLRRNPQGKLLAVMCLGLDHFKGINDTLGHQVGDKLLKTVAQRLRACLRSTDVVARFGGDEFVIASSSLDKPAEAAALAEYIREAILRPIDALGHQLVVDTCIGIALCPDDGTSAEELLKNADLALYAAKRSGRGTRRFFESEMDVLMTERRNLEAELRTGFANGEFEIHYQPLVNLGSDRITSCEALLRWNHPQRGWVSPQAFIPIAEEIGLITHIGEWVVRTACAAATNWPEDVSVSVNVSPIQFRNQKLIHVVTQALAASGLAPSRLEIEITEALLLEQTEEVLTVLRQLHGLGVRIAMDDFGTGYSSLSYLQKFPFDKIKIDRAFIKGLSEDDEANAIVRAVIGIADSFHMTTTAEGVETLEQREIITALGCTEMQGFLFSQARPAYEISDLLVSSETAQRVVHSSRN